MEISDSDIKKIQLITANVQVNDLIALLTNIDEEALNVAIDSTSIEDRASPMYQFLNYTLEFYRKIDDFFKKSNKKDDQQLDFKFNE